MGAALVLVGLLQPVTDIPHSPVVHAESHEVKTVEPVSPAPTQPVAQAKEETVVSPTIQETKPVPVAQDNETITWNFLIAQGFTREQTAGIMGNLQQEHNFRTDGDGLAQWLGDRKAALFARGGENNLQVQLEFIMYELNSYESGAMSAIKASSTVEQATLAFQNKFERCNPYYCHPVQRINYAYNILGRH